MKGVFTVATLNICGVLKHQEDSHLTLRMEWLVDYLKKSDIDFLAIQEVSFEVWKFLKQHEDELNYKLYPEVYDWASHVDDHVIVCSLSKSSADEARLAFFPHHTKNLDYCFLSVKFSDLQIINIHLNAGLENDNLREMQLEYIKSNILSNAEESNLIILGDFNSDLNNDNCVFVRTLREEWIDAWNKVGSGPGYTQDPEANYLRKLFGHSKGKRRVDGVLYHGDNYLVPQKIEIFGKEQIKDKIYPSDHYGVQCLFQMKSKPIPNKV